MVDAPSLILARFLQAKEIFCSPETKGAWPVYLASLPESPVQLAAIYDTSPVRKGRLMDGRELWAHGFQVRLRSRTYQAGWEKAVAVSDCLESAHLEVVTVGDYVYVIDSIMQTSRVLSIGQDEQRQMNFVVNGLVTFL